MVEAVGEDHAIILELLDNGSGADGVAGDGLYSRYFASHYDADKRYILKCQVSGDGTTHVNGGFTSSKKNQKAGDLLNYPLDPRAPGAPLCCGSSVPVNPDALEPTGEFTRESAGGSFKVWRLSTTCSE